MNSVPSRTTFTTVQLVGQQSTVSQHELLKGAVMSRVVMPTNPEWIFDTKPGELLRVASERCGWSEMSRGIQQAIVTECLAGALRLFHFTREVPSDFFAGYEYPKGGAAMVLEGSVVVNGITYTRGQIFRWDNSVEPEHEVGSIVAVHWLERPRRRSTQLAVEAVA